MRSVAVDGVRVLAGRPAASEVLVILAGCNERRHVEPLFAFYASQGVDVAYLDDGSTDGTLELALDHLGAPVVWVGARAFLAEFDMAGLMRMKERLILQVPHAWVVHADMDEYRSAPDATPLAEALAAVAEAGANAVNFQEFTFVPVVEAPDHDHAGYRETMRWYYPFSPRPLHRLNAFMPSPLGSFDLVSEAGHRVRAEGIRLHPGDFVLEHFPFLSLPHFREQYPARRFSAEDLQRGWHGNRIGLVEPPLSRAAELADRTVVGLVTDRARATHSWTVRASVSSDR